MYPEHWNVTFYLNDAPVWDLEDLRAPEFSVGDGLILPIDEAYPRVRVVDVWHSWDRHGRFDTGTHVFCENVTNTPDDRPKALAPDYFRDDA